MSDRIERDVSSSRLLDSEEPQQTSQPQQTAAETGVHPIVIKIAVGAAVWFVVTSWLAFAWGPEIDYLLVIVTLFFAIFFTLFLLTASFSVCALAGAPYEFSRVSQEQYPHRQRHDERPRSIDR